ncbi:hypothetical protein CF319_g918 [Tilletia indica]|uniref:Minor histocompatibility antigen H13 n=2 Tax=Tilletia TaxID=13289 RepID=A0A8X7T6L6_9BASI|nr:hypothetical protein CF327_g3650 [Tilletia walkeri]KAE8226510.1 hypothetical protein CF319_g918 [Tilletia indica]KAE8230390.1 hypothetical protein CF326_g4609 [Tilletia indica]KAE8256326.1 hypothetical protein A4X13_0g2711 [Tilletia indica]KAE8270746.1 hypothetical protein A4X09_0g1606 [Tilletia walkeri]
MSTSDRDLFIAYGALMSGALLPIYFGSYLSLRTPASTKQLLAERKKLRKANDDDADDDEEEEEEESSNETLTSEDAWLFPVFGSAVLFGMYLTFRYIDKAYINILLSVYFGIVGVFAVATASINGARGIVGRKVWKKMGVYKVSISKQDKDIFRTAFTNAHLPFVLLSILLVTYYVATRNWVASNIVALSLATNAITLMGLDSFRTGMIMLGGLFLYDIFWVFGTEVMVSVAKNFDAPIKILWPKNLIDVLQYLAGGGSISSQPKWAFTMLGLGDIVIPGIFISLALRFDQNQAAAKKPSTSFTRFKTNFPKPYFHATVLAYILGLATTMAVMHIFRAAQPALLYLSPACSAAVALTALVRGEWSAMWGWSDEEEEDEDQDGKKDGTKTADSSIVMGDGDAGASSDGTIRAGDDDPVGKGSAVENGSDVRQRGKGKKGKA